MTREVENLALDRVTMRDAMHETLRAALSGALTDAETQAFVMWLTGYSTGQIARVLVAHPGTPRERDGVTRSRAQQVLVTAQRKVADLTGLPIPVSGESIRRQGKRMTQRTPSIETRRPAGAKTPEGQLSEKECNTTWGYQQK